MLEVHVMITRSIYYRLERAGGGEGFISCGKHERA